ncbi:MAG: pantoate--beta-alanine ligase [Omnitrophica bacterium]|nr:pantoate--beta-alanine ligase [Candidatus Omnitrophota bacterium]
MKIIDKIDKMKTHARIIKKGNKLLGFVPTMGYLHEGHLSLIRAARKQSDVVTVSIFVNPIQFGQNEDYKKYPRDMQRDEELLKNYGVDILFYPEKKDMYPADFSTYVNVEKLTDGLCGKSRVGHFRGVTTVLVKLFEIIKPDIAYFGQKDAQQAFVIKKMIKDLNMDITMKILPTVREADGLAMSSRNTYLTGTLRKDAGLLNRSLILAADLVRSGEKDAKKIIKSIKDFLLASPNIKIDYIAITDTKELRDIAVVRGETLVAVSAFVGKTRLIDNVIINEKKAQENWKYDGLLSGRQAV